MIFVETSVLVASWQEAHTHHEQSFGLIQSLDPATACTSVHCIVELFSVLTRMPPRLRVSPGDALHLVEQTRTVLSIIALDAMETFDTFNRFAALDLGGGMVYDAMILACARKADAQKIYTWNKKHFDRLAPDLDSRIVLP